MKIKESNSNIASNLWLAGIVLTFSVLLSTIYAGAKGEILSDSVKDILNSYRAFCIGGIFCILIFYFILLLMEDDEYGDSVLFNSVGDFPSFKIPFVPNGWALGLLSIIVFTIIGLLTTLNQQSYVSFSDTPFTQEAFSPVQSIVFTSLLVPGSENAVAGGLIAIAIAFAYMFARRQDWSSINYRLVIGLISVIIPTAYSVALHYTRYSGSDVALISVAIFWALGGLVTFLTGSFIPFWIWHIENNIFYAIQSQFAGDTIYYVMGTFLGVSIIAYIILFVIYNKD